MMDKSNAATPDRGVDWNAYADAMNDDEEGVCRLIESLVLTDKLADLWELPRIVRCEREFPFPRGRADFALFHVDGTVTLVEVKRGGLAERDILTGVGQLSLYAAQVRGHLYVRRLLAVAIAGDDPRALYVMAACKLAGVTFEPLGPMSEHRAALRAQ